MEKENKTKAILSDLEHTYYVLNKELAILEGNKQRIIQQLNNVISQIENYNIPETNKTGEKK